VASPLWTAPLEDEFGTAYAYALAAGRSVHDCAIIGQRFEYEEGFQWSRSESWVVRIRPTGLADQPSTARLVLGGRSWLTRVWVSPSGRFWVTSMDGRLYEETADGGYRTHQLGVPLSGVWGIRDDCVYAWSEVRQRLYRWNGSAFRDVPCPGRVLVLAGLGEDDLLAGGYDGLVWRWDGQTWRDISVLLAGNVVGIAVASPDRAFACCTEGDIAEITPHGAQIALRWGGPLLDVTPLGPDLLLAAGSSGVWRLTTATNVMEPVTGDFAAERFDQRDGTILISADEGVVQTTDGATFAPTASASFLGEQRRGQPPLWRP
jgi:hypothetical protein